MRCALRFNSPQAQHIGKASEFGGCFLGNARYRLTGAQCFKVVKHCSKRFERLMFREVGGAEPMNLGDRVSEVRMNLEAV